MRCVLGLLVGRLQRRLFGFLFLLQSKIVYVLPSKSFIFVWAFLSRSSFAWRLSSVDLYLECTPVITSSVSGIDTV